MTLQQRCFNTWTWFLAGLFLVFIPACDRPPEPLKIGLAVNLSGVGGDAGEHIRDGALLAVEEVNRSGGINGRPLVLLVRDDRNTAEGIISADESLLNEKVIAIIGHSYSSNTIIAYPLVTSRETLLITAYTATTKLSGKDDLFLRTSVDSALYGQKLVALLNRKKAGRISILVDWSNLAYVEDFMVQLMQLYKGKTVQVDFDSRQHVDWNKTVAALLATQPDAVVFIAEANSTGVALQKLRDQKYAGQRVATVWTQTPELLKVAGDAAEGLSIITYIDPDNSRPEYLLFDQKMREKFGKPASARSARAHEMVSILADGLRRCRQFTARELKAALLSGSYSTIMGTLAFDQYGDVVRPVYEVVVKGGVFRNNGEIR